MPDQLSSEALEWTKTHLKRFGDTDIFPVPFEYEAISHGWNFVKPHLISVDMKTHVMGEDRRVLVVKPGGGFRAATQLDPIDQYLYTATCYEYANLVEQSRIPADKKVACSYRINITPEGSLFASDTGWDDFHGRSKSLSESGQYSHVLVADIADFYNRLGHHRVQNALEMANVGLERSQNIERFLAQLTAKQSQGVPVGPLASIVIAEACLMDVDNFLLRNGHSHTRYVDDFRIFCNSRREAINIKLILSDYLFSVHRLSLESSKSQIYSVQRFIDNELSDPKEQEENARLKALNEMYDELEREHGRYWYEEQLDQEFGGELESAAQKEALTGLFQLCVERRPLHLGLARHLIRKAARQRTNILNETVFNNFETFGPVLRDVVNYLAITIPKNNFASRGHQLLEFANSSDIADLPFVQMWIVELICRRPELISSADAMKYGQGLDPSLGCRPMALLAKAYNQIEWVRARKETWRNHEAWCRRAIIFGSSILPVGERRPFLGMVSEQGSLLEKVVANWLLSQ